MSTEKTPYLVTSALPYANGPLHFGHLAGVYLPSDVYVRHLRLMQEKVVHICGSDEHGVAIMLNAKKAQKPYKEYVDSWHADHKNLFKKFTVDFDFFGQTSEPYHAEEVKIWFDELYKKGFIGTRDNQQLFCKDCKNHLPDRFVEGECYSCHYPNARGDECPNCGILVDSTKLIKPVCQICGSKNIEEVTVTQYYLLLSKYHQEFRKWFETKKSVFRKTVWPFVDSLTRESLHDRAISRDLDWGIDVPLAEARGKKLYVWFDAPIGYVSNLKKYLEEKKSSEHYLKDWFLNENTKLIHFLSKDNIIFHCIIFPVMGMASKRMLPPHDVPSNQYLNLLGKQFSKSSGWYVDAHKAIDQFGDDALRYYLLAIMPDFTDSSFSWDQFAEKVNNELANNIGNMVNRCLKFSFKNWPQGLEAESFKDFANKEITKSFSKLLKEQNAEVYDKNMRRGLELVMKMGHEANAFFNDQAPWAKFKVDPSAAAVVIAESSLLIFALGVALSPYLPTLSSKILSLFDLSLSDSDKKCLYEGDMDLLPKLFAKGIKLTSEPSALVPKIDPEVIKTLNAELAQKNG
jgi:methionyl-tRNA synthetase